jgi:2-haloacid dehalogenase
VKYQVILFDADGTLFDYDYAEAYGLESTFQHFKLQYIKEKHLSSYRTINNALWKDLEAGRITSSKLRIERFETLFNETNSELDYLEFSQVYLTFLSQATMMIDGAYEICQYLSQRYKLVIVTNGMREVQIPRIQHSRLKGYIEHIVISEDAGYQKPDPRFFDYASKIIGQEIKDHAIIIGDSLSSDILGGSNYGLPTCWYNPARSVNRTEIVPNFEINHLLELKNFL